MPADVERLEASASALGARIDRVCFVGASASTAKVLFPFVAAREGTRMTAETVREDLQALVLTELVGDVRAVALPLGGPEPRVILVYGVSEYARLMDIEFVNRPYGEVWPRLEDSLLEKLGRPVSRVYVAELIQRFNAEAVEMGFAESKIAFELKPMGDHEVGVVVRGNTGPKFLTSAVQFNGVRQVSESELRKVISTLVGAPYRRDRVEADRDFVLQHYYDRGMINVAVVAQTTKEANDRMAVAFAIEEGDVYRVGNVKLAGLSLGSEEELLELIEPRTNDIYARAAFARTVKRLEERALTRGLRISVEPTPTIDAKRKTIDFVLRIEQLPPPKP